MKVRILLLIVLLFPVSLYCQENYIFSNLITYGETENFDISFKNINFSEEFIEKFNLNEAEINFIGYWTDNFYSEIKQNGKNVRILGLDFFPNRIMKMSTECFIGGERTQRIYFFFWKIEKEIMYIKTLTCLSKTKNKNTCIELFNNTDYKIAGSVKFYNSNFVLLKQFDFTFMNSIINEKNIEFGMDDFRYRILLGRAMPSIYDKIGTNSNLRQFLLSFDATKKSDFIKLEADSNYWN